MHPMRAVKEILPDGTVIWHIDKARLAVVALLGDDFDYSTTSQESLDQFADDIRELEAKVKAMEPGPESAAAILRGDI